MFRSTIFIVLPVLALAGYGVSDSRWTGGFLIANGLILAITGFPYRLPKAIVFWWGALLWGALTWATGFLVPLSSWRSSLTQAGLGTSACWSPQPWVSLESWILFLAGLLWLCWMLSDPPSEKVRLRTLRILGIGIGAVGVLVLICRTQGWPFPGTDVESEGFFPNRNHMSNWLAMGGLAAAGAALADLRRRQFLWSGASLLAVAGVMVCLAANTSRGGLLIFFLGLLFWSLALTWRGPDRWTGPALLTLVVLGAASILFAGGKSLERFKSPSAPPAVRGGIEDTPAMTARAPAEAAPRGDPNLDFRLQLHLDTLGLLAATPLFGTGPGNFSALFPPFRERTVGSQYRAAHPESDGLWFAAEYGLPALILALIGTLGLFAQAAPGKNREGWVTRSAAAAAVAAFLFHGLVDVPGHLIGTVWLAIVLAGLAFGRKRDTGGSSPLWVRVTLRSLAAAVAAAGLVWTLGLLRAWPWPASVAAERAATEIIAGWRSQELEQSLLLADRAVLRAPLDENLHFLRGKTLLFFENSSDEADEEFARQARLEPIRVTLWLDQASAWAEWRPQDHDRALAALRRGLELVDRLPVGSHGYHLMREGLSAVARLNPGLRPGITGLLASRPELLAQWLGQSRAEEFLPAWAALRTQDPALQAFSDPCKNQLFRVWARLVPPSEVLQESRRYPQWGSAIWPIDSQLLAREKRHQEAVERVREFLPPPPLPGREILPKEAERRYYRSPRDNMAAFCLAEGRREAGDFTGARIVLEQVTQRDDVPAYFWWLRSDLEAKENRWESAWQSLLKYLQATQKDWPKI